MCMPNFDLFTNVKFISAVLYFCLQIEHAKSLLIFQAFKCP